MCACACTFSKTKTPCIGTITIKNTNSITTVTENSIDAIMKLIKYILCFLKYVNNLLLNKYPSFLQMIRYINILHVSLSKILFQTLFFSKDLTKYNKFYYFYRKHIIRKYAALHGFFFLSLVSPILSMRC